MLLQNASRDRSLTLKLTANHCFYQRRHNCHSQLGINKPGELAVNAVHGTYFKSLTDDVDSE